MVSRLYAPGRVSFGYDEPSGRLYDDDSYVMGTEARPRCGLSMLLMVMVGGVGSLRLRPLFVPSIAIPSRPPRLFWIN